MILGKFGIAYGFIQFILYSLLWPPTFHPSNLRLICAAATTYWDPISVTFASLGAKEISSKNIYLRDDNNDSSGMFIHYSCPRRIRSVNEQIMILTHNLDTVSFGKAPNCTMVMHQCGITITTICQSVCPCGNLVVEIGFIFLENPMQSFVFIFPTRAHKERHIKASEFPSLDAPQI